MSNIPPLIDDITLTMDQQAAIYRARRRQSIQARAHAEAIRRENITNISLHHEAIFGEEVFIVGANPELGGWDPQKAIKLSWTEGHYWKREIEFCFARGTEFKYIIKRNGQVVWEEGENRRIEASTHILNDFW
eukprot:Platyproteum_vivax@DN15871_c0_g1_i1.p1